MQRMKSTYVAIVLLIFLFACSAPVQETPVVEEPEPVEEAPAQETVAEVEPASPIPENVPAEPYDHTAEELGIDVEIPEGTNKGDYPPDFTLTTIDGEEFVLSEHRGEKPVLVYFMATWCPHCRDDFDALSTLYDEFKDDVEIVSLSLDLSENSNALKAYRNRFPALADLKLSEGSSDILTDFKVRATTTKYAIGRDGTIIYSGSSAFSESQWRTLLEGLKSSA